MDFDIHALIEDTETARIQLYNQHCRHATDQTRAAIGLASQLLFQAGIVLEAVYGSKELAAKHARLAFSP